MKVFGVFLVFLVLFVLVCGAAWAIDTYSVSLPAGSALTMGDGSGVLIFIVTNDPASVNSVKYVEFVFDNTLYNTSGDSAAPANWSIPANLTFGGVIAFISATDPIAPGQNRIFQVRITGVSGGSIPSGALDQTDTLSNMRVSKGYNSSFGTITGPKTPLFTNPGSFPNWQRKALAISVSASPSAVGAGETISLTAVVFNRSSVAQNNVSPSTPDITATGTAGAIYVSGPIPSVVSSLATGSSTEFAWTYTASPAGTIQFKVSASDGAAISTSIEKSSNSVEIGDFVAAMSLSPATIVSGQEVTITMSVQNNGATSLGNITPSVLVLNTSGSATYSVTSGPSPSSIASLAPGGAGGSFEWTVEVYYGAVGDTFAFEASASSSTINSNIAESNQGTVSFFSVVMNPTSISSGSVDKTFQFQVVNNGGYPLRQVKIHTPSAPSGFVYQSASGGYSTDWSVMTDGSPPIITFYSVSDADDIPVGQTGIFDIIYSSVPIVSSDTEAGSTVELFERSGDPWELVNPVGTFTPNVLITSFAINVSAEPSSGIPADGNSQSAIVATLTSGGTPAVGKTISFSASKGVLSSATAQTGADGKATVSLIAPVSSADTSAQVTASYLDAQSSVEIFYTGVTAPNLVYVGGTLLPNSGIRNHPAGFSLRVNNTGTTEVILSIASTFSFTDGASVYTSTLSAPATIAGGATNVLLGFSSQTIPVTFAPGFYNPALHLTNELDYSQNIGLTDTVKVRAPNIVVTLTAPPVVLPDDPGNSGEETSTITYVAEIVNQPGSTSAPATNVLLQNKLPLYTNYKSGSIKVDGVPKTDAADSDEGEYDGVSVVSVDLGTMEDNGAPRVVEYKVIVQ